MKVPFLDLRVGDKELRRRLLKKIDSVLQHGRLIEGPEQIQFEEKIAREIGVRHAVGVSSGSSALYLALRSSGIGSGDEVITTPFTWIISTHAITSTGAKPVFVDVREDCNLDPSAIEQAITTKTKAILPVHVGGHMCDMPAIVKVAKHYKLKIVEDAAQAYCASLNGRRAGTFSDMAGFSFNPMKVLFGYGEAGAVTTNSARGRDLIHRLRHAGTSRDPTGKQINRSNAVSLNHKMDTIQAALLLDGLSRINEIWGRREKIANLYNMELGHVLRPPPVATGESHGRYLYMAYCRKRNQLKKFLQDGGIESRVFYSPLTARAVLYQSSGKDDFPVARNLERMCLALPLHEKLSERQVQYVIEKVKKFYSSS